MWNTDEVGRLKQLRLDPVQNSPEKLMGLVRYFAGPHASVFGITEGNELPHVSKDLARKVRDLMRDRKLDWVLERDQKTAVGGSHDLVQTQVMMRRVGGVFLLENTDPALDSRVDMLGHWQALLPVVRELEAITPPEPVGDQAWFSLMKREKGRIFGGTDASCRNDDMHRIEFFDGQIEWAYLKEHLPSDPLWGIITAWNASTARYLAARGHLFRALIDLTQSSPDQGGTGLPVLPDFAQSESDRPSLHLYYALLLYDQVMAQGLRFRYRLKEPSDFRRVAEGSVSLGGWLAVVSCTREQEERAVRFFVQTQTKLAEQDETGTAVAAYAEVERLTNELKRNLRRILLLPGPPPDQHCEACRPWFGAGRPDILVELKGRDEAKPPPLQSVRASSQVKREKTPSTPDAPDAPRASMTPIPTEQPDPLSDSDAQFAVTESAPELARPQRRGRKPKALLMRQAQEAYSHLHDMDWLEDCDLRRLPAVQDRVRLAHAMPQGRALRSVLAEAMRRVLADLDGIPANSRVRTFIERYLEGCRVSEIANELGISREHCSRTYRTKAFGLASEQFLRIASRSAGAR